jgi:hypothetical protein
VCGDGAGAIEEQLGSETPTDAKAAADAPDFRKRRRLSILPRSRVPDSLRKVADPRQVRGV